MPCTLHLANGETLDVETPLAQARIKAASKAWHSFVTTLGNPCRVDCSKIEKVTPIRTK